MPLPLSMRSDSNRPMAFMTNHPLRELHERLLLRNEQTKHIRLPEVYKEDENAKVNVTTWMNAQFIHEAVDKLLPVGHTHSTAVHLANSDSGPIQATHRYVPQAELPTRLRLYPRRKASSTPTCTWSTSYSFLARHAIITSAITGDFCISTP